MIINLIDYNPVWFLVGSITFCDQCAQKMPHVDQPWSSCTWFAVCLSQRWRLFAYCFTARRRSCWSCCDKMSCHCLASRYGHRWSFGQTRDVHTRVVWWGCPAPIGTTTSRRTWTRSHESQLSCLRCLQCHHAWKNLHGQSLVSSR